MELMNKNVKGLDSPNTIEGWQVHSQNIILALASHTFVTNKYTNHQSLDVQNAKNSGMDNYVDISQKGKTKIQSTPSNCSKEKVICSEILSLAQTFVETNKRKFDNSSYWDMLSSTTTKLSNESNTSDHCVDTDTLSEFTASLFDKHTIRMTIAWLITPC